MSVLHVYAAIKRRSPESGTPNSKYLNNNTYLNNLHFFIDTQICFLEIILLFLLTVDPAWNFLKT